jgi:hypothetical protein
MRWSSSVLLLIVLCCLDAFEARCWWRVDVVWDTAVQYLDTSSGHI